MGIAILVIMAVASAVVSHNTQKSCSEVPLETLAAIEGGAESSYAPLQLENGKAIAVTLTYPNGNQVDGFLVAATTPAGVGVWAMDAPAYAGGNGNIQAVNAAAYATANWGGSLPNPVSDADVATAAACVAG